jgi:hypothetical protein
VNELADVEVRTVGKCDGPFGGLESGSHLVLD